MKKLLILVLAVLLLTGCAALPKETQPTAEPTTEATQPATEAAQPTTQPTEPARQAAPDFTMYTLEGEPVNLSDFRGKPTILNFWASWCGPCKMEMPDLEEAYLTYGGEINFLIVNLTDGTSETVESAHGYIESQGYTFPVYYDTVMGGTFAYGVSAIPVTYFIDAEGNLVAYYEGAMTADILRQGISMIHTLEE